MNHHTKRIMQHGINNSTNPEGLEKIHPRKARPPLSKGATLRPLNKPLFEKEGLRRFIRHVIARPAPGEIQTAP